MPYFKPVKAPLAVLGLFLLAWSAAADPALPSPDDPAALAQWFSDLGPRREGSGAEDRVFAALRAWFPPALGVVETGFDAMEGEHSFSRQLWFRIGGRSPGELVVVAPTDGANHKGLAWAVAWAKAALASEPQVSLTFLFTGAERGSSSGLGSRAFLQDFYPTDPAAALYLDASETEFQLELTTESGLFPSPLWMVRGLTEAFQDHGLAARYTGTAPSLFRLDLPDRRNAMAPWFERSIPVILVAGGPPSPSVVQSLADFDRSLTAGVPKSWDRHYLVFDFGSQKIFWSQGTYLVIFLSVAGLLLFGYALAGRRHRGTLRILGTGFWQLPVLFSFLFLALYAGTGAAEVLQQARGLPDFWTTNPLLVWTFKAFVTITLYLLLFLPSRRSPLSRNPDFYGQAALVWLGAMVLVSAGFELSFSFYFLWALVCCAVLVTVPWRPLRFLALLAGPLWLVKAAWDVLGPQPDQALTQWALDSPLAGNFALAVLFFPFLLQVNAWNFSGRSHQDRNDGLRAAAQLGLFGLATLFLGLGVLRVPPAGNTAPQMAVTLDLRAAPRNDLWSTRVSHTAFLDRTVWSIRFQGASDPEELVLWVGSEEPLTIFDCSFPVTLAADGHRAQILVGRQPRLPLDLRLTLPASVHAHVEVQVRFEGSPGLEATDNLELHP